MKKAIIILAEGFEEIEAVTVIDILRRAEIEVNVTGLTARQIIGSHGIPIYTDSVFDDAKERLTDFDLIVLPGGLPGSHNLRDDPRVLSILNEMYGRGKFVAAICAAPIVLAKAGLLDGKKATSYPGQLESLNLQNTELLKDTVVIDDRIITSRGPATAMEFSLCLVELLVGKDVRNKLEKGMLINSKNFDV